MMAQGNFLFFLKKSLLKKTPRNEMIFYPLKVDFNGIIVSPFCMLKILLRIFILTSPAVSFYCTEATNAVHSSFVVKTHPMVILSP